MEDLFIEQSVTLSFEKFLLLHNQIANKLFGVSVEEEGIFEEIPESLKVNFEDDQTGSNITFIKLEDYYLSEDNSLKKSVNTLFENNPNIQLFLTIYNNRFQKLKKRARPKSIKNMGRFLKELRGDFLNFKSKNDTIKVSYLNDLSHFNLYCLFIVIQPPDFFLTLDDIPESIQKLNLFNFKYWEIPDDDTLEYQDSSIGSNGSNIELAEANFDNETTGTTYSAYYYSFRQNKVLFFDIKFFYDIKPTYSNVEKQDYYVIERGFHDDLSNPIYKGYAYRLSDLKLHVVLMNKSLNDLFKIILDAGKEPETHAIMSGAMMAISADQDKRNTLCYEVLLIKKSEQTQEKENNIKRYLFFHRYNFMIRLPKYSAASTTVPLKVKGKKVTLFDNFVGVWQVWRFCDEYEEIINSILFVGKDYRIYCISNQYDNDDDYDVQPCHLSITNSDTICLSTAPSHGSKIISKIFLRKIGKSKKVSGSMITVGKYSDRPIMRAIALLKKESNWENYFDSNGYPSFENIHELKMELINVDRKTLTEQIEINSNYKTLYKLLIQEISENNRHPDWIFDFV